MTHEEYESKSQMKRVEILKAEEKQMSHDELLTKFTDYEAHFDQVRDEPKVFAMLRAVVELHKPISVIIGDNNGNIHTKFSKWQCKGCYGEYNHFSGVYPCPTIQAIERELI